LRYSSSSRWFRDFFILYFLPSNLP
jgi:hypothetical protein